MFETHWGRAAKTLSSGLRPWPYTELHVLGVMLWHPHVAQRNRSSQVFLVIMIKMKR